MSEEAERAYCVKAAAKFLGEQNEEFVHVIYDDGASLADSYVRLRAEAFEAGRKSRDGEVADMDAGHDATHANLVRVADLLDACKAKLARVEAAAKEYRCLASAALGRAPQVDDSVWDAEDALRAAFRDDGAALADSGEKP